MIIVSGRIYAVPGTRARLLSDSREAMHRARQARGCRDFVVAADPVEPDRVNVYEEWDTAADLDLFRGNGPQDTVTANIARSEVSRHQVTASGPA